MIKYQIIIHQKVYTFPVLDIMYMPDYYEKGQPSPFLNHLVSLGFFLYLPTTSGEQTADTQPSHRRRGVDGTLTS